MAKKARKYAVPGLAKEYHESHNRCACCWRVRRRGEDGSLQCHHLLSGRVGRPDALWNFLLLCARCHGQLGHGRENLAVCLTLKMQEDYVTYDIEAMQAHVSRFGREKMPGPAPLPEWILTARRDSWQQQLAK